MKLCLSENFFIISTVSLSFIFFASTKIFFYNVFCSSSNENDPLEESSDIKLETFLSSSFTISKSNLSKLLEFEHPYLVITMVLLC